MTTLLDTSFPGADENPLSTPFVNATGGHRKISNQVAVVNTSTFSVAVDDSNTYPADHEATVYVATLGLRDFGPAVCINTANGACYFITNGSATDVWVYYYNGVGGFTQIGTIAGMVYAVSDAITLRREGTGIKVYQNGSQVGSTITDTNLSSGKAGISGYDNTNSPSAHRISRFIGADLNVVTGPTPGAGSLLLAGIAPTVANSTPLPRLVTPIAAVTFAR